MNRKCYEISRMKRNKLIVPQCHFRRDGGGCFIYIYLTDDEYDKLKDIEIVQNTEFCKIMKKRSMYYKDYNMEYLYKVAPWLFEY